jgi:hypothetical protein
VVGLLNADRAWAGPITFDFTGSQGGATGEGSVGNVRTFTSGGVTVSVSGWSYTYDVAPGTDNALGQAALGRWSSGLGVCNVTETPCSSPDHQVDNVGIDDWVLFVFSAPVDITTVRIDPYGTFDRDVSYYVGNVSTPLSLTGVNYAGLTALGFSSVLYSSEATASDAYRDVSIAGGTVNALLLGGYRASDQDDYFKIRSLSADYRVPEPATAVMMLMGIAAIGARRRAQGRNA